MKLCFEQNISILFIVYFNVAFASLILFKTISINNCHVIVTNKSSFFIPMFTIYSMIIILVLGTYIIWKIVNLQLFLSPPTKATSVSIYRFKTRARKRSSWTEQHMLSLNKETKVVSLLLIFLYILSLFFK